MVNFYSSSYSVMISPCTHDELLQPPWDSLPPWFWSIEHIFYRALSMFCSTGCCVNRDKHKCGLCMKLTALGGGIQLHTWYVLRRKWWKILEWGGWGRKEKEGNRPIDGFRLPEEMTFQLRWQWEKGNMWRERDFWQRRSMWADPATKQEHTRGREWGRRVETG